MPECMLPVMERRECHLRVTAEDRAEEWLWGYDAWGRCRFCGQDVSGNPKSALRIILRRVCAALICLALFVLFWGSFLVAENDAYCCGHGGFVHQPWGVIGYVASALLIIPVMILAMKLWDGRDGRARHD
jgi:hypothetical protein